jgi:hypothetical protein
MCPKILKRTFLVNTGLQRKTRPNGMTKEKTVSPRTAVWEIDLRCGSCQKKVNSRVEQVSTPNTIRSSAIS